MSYKWQQKSILVAIVLTLASPLSNADALRYTREGTMYRIAAADDGMTSPRSNYVITDREEDDQDTAEIRVNRTLKSAIPLREAVALLLEGREIAVRFSGSRAMEAAGKLTGPAMFSGSLKGALNGIANQAGLQVYIRSNQVEFVDRRTYRLTLPSYENTTEVARRLHGTRATNVRIAGGNVIEFDADPEELRSVRTAINEIKVGRRGTGAFMARMAESAEVKAMTQRDAETKLRQVEEQAAKKLVQDRSAIGMSAEATPPKARHVSDPLMRVVSIDCDACDATDALRRITLAAGIDYKITRPPVKSIRVTMALHQAPLRAALEVLDREMRGAADLVYVKEKQRVEFLAR